MSVSADISFQFLLTILQISSYLACICDISCREEPMLDDDLPGLLPKLRPYQRRAAYWMVQREKRNSDGSLQSKINHFISPLCMPLSLIDTSITVYYNPFWYVPLSMMVKKILPLDSCTFTIL